MTATNVVAALFATLAGALFLLLGWVHLRRRPTLLRGRTITLACVLVFLYPLFIQPIHEVLQGVLLGEAYGWTAVLRLALFVAVTVGVGWYFRGWLLFNVDTGLVGDLIGESCRAIDVACRAVGPAGESRRFRLGPEGRELRIRRESASRYASFYIRGEKRLPWLADLGGELRRRVSRLRTGRYYSRAVIYLFIGLLCLGLAVILLVPERLGLIAPSVLPLEGFPR